MTVPAWIRRSFAGSSYALMPALVALALFVANVVIQPAFIDRASWASTIALASPYVLTALAQAFPVLSGNVGLDLSVGPFAGFVCVFVAGQLVPAGVDSPELLIPTVLAFGLVAGMVNGVLIAYVHLPPIIATLGAYLFYSGMSSYVLPVPGGTVPGWLIDISGSYGPIPGMLVVFAVVTAGWLLLSRTVYVQNLLGVGGDERFAFSAGVNVSIVRLWAYAFAGMLAALAGLMLTSVIQSGDATVGPSYTISSIAAVALGGIALGGGRGGLLGAAIGGVTLYLIQNLLTVAKVGPFQLDIANGAILLAALALNGVSERMRRRRGGGQPPLLVPQTTGGAVPTGT